MNSLDSIKIKVSNDSIDLINGSCFYKDTQEYYNGLTKVKHKMELRATILGLKSIELIEDHAIIEMSAKLLGADYYKGININTIGKVTDIINDSKIIKLKSDFPNNAELLRADVSNNMKVNNINETIQGLNVLRINPKYTVTDYKGSIVFKRDVKSYKERMTFYDKLTELSLSRNKKIFDLVNKDDFYNVVRCESNITSFAGLRNAFKTTTQNLYDILSSKEKVNFKTFGRIANEKDFTINYQKIEDFKIYKSLSELETMQGRYGIIRACNCEIKIIRDVVSHYIKKSNIRRELLKYKKLIKEMSEITEHQKTIVEKVKSLLKAA